jgi:guanine nucleotide exchange factor VAV
VKPSLETRDHVINELVETEKNFLLVLKALRYKFMQPMEKLLKGDTPIIFPRIRELLDLHQDLYDRFIEATKPHPKVKLSSVFIDFRERFLIYGDYCSKLTLATDTLREVCKTDSEINELVNVS